MTSPLHKTLKNGIPARTDELDAIRSLADADQRLWRRREGLTSLARLGSFVAAALFWWVLPDSAVGQWMWVIAGLALFAQCVSLHRRAKARREAADRMLTLIEESAQRLGGRVVLIRGHERPPAGEVGLPLCYAPGPSWPLTKQEVDDLDLYNGPVGLFGLLNRTSTHIGARRLSYALENPGLDRGGIAARQEAVRWLESHPSERLRLMAGAAALRGWDQPLDAFIRALIQIEPMPPIVQNAALRLWSWPTAGLALFALYQAGLGHYEWSWLLVGLWSVNTVIYLSMARRLEGLLVPWRSLAPVVQRFGPTPEAATALLPPDGLLGSLRNPLVALHEAGDLRKLHNAIGWVDVGGMLHVMANTLLFYDLHAAHRLLSLVHPQRAALLQSLSALAELEVFTSLAAFAWEQPVRCFPEFADSSRLLIRQGRHPLISPETVVPNDVDLNDRQRLWVITGSNMAGKSTFLRMVGLNVLLAQMGGPACAEAMAIAPLRLVSDLRVRDDLGDNESYFLAEVRHLRRMVTPPPGAAAILGLADEPFRGTNSQEQVAATLAVVEHLKASGHLFLIATHEQRVTELANDEAARNVHFQENLGTEGLTFDYLLRPGPAQTRNALLLLEREGYPKEVLDRARDRLHAPPP